jgi:hypothetical protein
MFRSKLYNFYIMLLHNELSFLKKNYTLGTNVFMNFVHRPEF